jgi:hypothetical protein
MIIEIFFGDGGSIGIGGFQLTIEYCLWTINRMSLVKEHLTPRHGDAKEIIFDRINRINSGYRI